MNHRRRVENALRRVLAPHLHKSDLFELLTIEFERVAHQIEVDAHRIAVARAANLAGDSIQPLVDDETRFAVVRAIVGIEARR